MVRILPRGEDLGERPKEFAQRWPVQGVETVLSDGSGQLLVATPSAGC